MRVIVTHDVDHIRVFEHKKDLIIPKFCIRSFVEFSLGYISHIEIKNRFKDFLSNKWNNLEELMRFDKEKRIPATFFIGVSKGRGLSYSLDESEYWIKRIIDEGFSVGVHGIAFDNLKDMEYEYETFKRISELDSFGIRIHYLKNNEKTFEFLNKIGYQYDSSIYALENPYKVGKLWEFPLSIMDGYIFHVNSRYQNQDLKQAKDTTKRIIEEASNKDLKYFVILFHDRYFSESFKTWKEWYIWLIEYLKENKFEFINFESAIKEL